MQNRHETTNRGAGLALYFHEKRFGRHAEQTRNQNRITGLVLYFHGKRFGRHAKQIRNLVHGQLGIFTATKRGAGSVLYFHEKTFGRHAKQTRNHESRCGISSVFS